MFRRLGGGGGFATSCLVERCGKLAVSCVRVGDREVDDSSLSWMLACVASFVVILLALRALLDPGSFAPTLRRRRASSTASSLRLTDR
jgi:hypothetical protein